ncbi:uncharacterized protein LOC142483928 isoform X2 [Ascaphus truei]|uniref:uncharacterized protein LOC142483928 isoform X2 n=1 Tax=Ascaphus truei TaxID=8439 RepID=UPI003F597DEE
MTSSRRTFRARGLALSQGCAKSETMATNSAPKADGDSMEIAALGRPFSIGMLYDCRNDKLTPGVTLWDTESLKKDLRIQSQENTSFEIIASDSISDKANALNVTASLKASFLGGLVTVGGSAAYLNDTKKSKNQARVSLQYSRTTRFEQLSMNQLGSRNITYKEVFEQRTATHVVVGILYGAQAFFIFDREVSSSENIRDIQGSLNLSIKGIPSISIEGEGSVKMSEKDKENANKFSCKFHGDFALESNPSNYEEAIKIYRSLPKMLGEKGEHAVPVKVWLYPLVRLDTTAAKMVRDISVNLLFEAECMMEQIREVTMQFNDMMKHYVAITFPDIKTKIQKAKDFSHQSTLSLQKQLAKILPAIRGGGEEESILGDILISRGLSPFNTQHFNEFLSRKLQEMNFVNSYLIALNEVKVISTESELNLLVLNPTIDCVLSLNFSSLDDEEEYLKDLSIWLQKEISSEKAYVDKTVMPWFKEKQVSNKARLCLKAFQTFYKVNASSECTKFIVSSTPDPNNAGVSVYLYDKGDLVSTEFNPPAKPNPPVILRRSYDSIELKLIPADFGVAEIDSYKVEYKCEDEKWREVNTQSNLQRYAVKDLLPNSRYQFRYAAVCIPGLSEVSDGSDIAMTQPSSPPGIPHAALLGDSEITLMWKEPVTIGKEVQIRQYKMEYQPETKQGTGKDSWTEQICLRKRETCDIDGLLNDTSYRFRVSAIYEGNLGVSDPSDEAIILIPKDRQEQRACLLFLKESTLLTAGKPSIYQLGTTLLQNGPEGCRRFILGKERLQRNKKVILLLGVTGTGKTSLINMMVNYALGVQRKDNFRFKLVQEATNQTQSTTGEVTIYEINAGSGFQIPFSLTIVDTPGFEDTLGVGEDEITQKIQNVFSTSGGIDSLDAICFVIQAAPAVFTPKQKLVLQSMFSIFGNDIKDNIQLLITFSDGQTPPVLKAIEESNVLFPKDEAGLIYFKFNNSVLFDENTTVGGDLNFNELYWKMGTRSVKDFFAKLNILETRSLTLTKEVLREREELGASLKGMGLQIKTKLVKLDELRKTQEALRHHMNEKEGNKNFEYTVNVIVPTKEVLYGSLAMNCNNCCTTCCWYGDTHENATRYLRTYITNMNYCQECPRKCDWTAHTGNDFKWTQIVKAEKRTYEDLKKKYEEASRQVTSLEMLTVTLQQEFSRAKEEVLRLISEASQRLRRLQEISLRANLTSTTDYIEQLIKEEEAGGKPGSPERVRSLKELKVEVETLERSRK